MTALAYEIDPDRGHRPSGRQDQPVQWVVGATLALRSPVGSSTAGQLADALARSPRPEHVTVRATEPPRASGMAAIKAIRDDAAAAGASFSLDLVVPDDADVPNHLLGRSGWLADAAMATRLATEDGIHLRWLVPLTQRLVYRLDGIVSLAQDLAAEPVLLFADALTDTPSATFVALASDDRLFAWDFVSYRLLEDDLERLNASRIAYYEKLKAALASGASDDWSALHSAALAPCREEVTGVSSVARYRTMAADIADVLSGGVLGHLRAVFARSAPANTPARAAGVPIPFALLIGAYGGEHIGDFAILGGVLRRIHARHGTARAILMTQRPVHTRHLVPMLESPVEIEVREYTLPNIHASVRETDGIIFAGGPLIDLPKQLVRHLVAATAARRGGKPFIMEGIGPSTFPRKPSEITARRLVTLADRVSVRTREDAQRSVVQGRSVEVGRCPAFDYLETRGPSLTRLAAGERAEIDALLADTEGRFVIGLNIRPIRDLYTPAGAGEDKGTVTRRVEERFEAEFASGLSAFAKASRQPVTYAFFPMNAIQFGKSDLHSAFRILKRLEPGIDFRVWEADASLDGVIALVRRLDAAVTMRFHATIFALSQDCPVAGIDYRIGKRDKVAAVLADAGHADDCCGIDELSAEWVCAKLLELQERAKRP